MTKDTIPIRPKRLLDLLRAVTAARGDPEVPWFPDLEELRRALGVEAVRLTLFGTDGAEPRTGATPADAGPWPRPADMHIPCRHDSRTLGRLEVRAAPGRELVADQRWALELIADRIALEACHRQLEQALTASALGVEASAAARLIDGLRQERDLRENVLAGAPNGVIAVDAERRVILMNNAARHFFAEGEAPGLQQDNPVERYLPQQPLLERLQRVLSGASDMEVLELSQGAAAHRRDYLINISPLCRGEARGATLVARDMTEQRRLDEQVLRIGRVASLGRVAAGIAHEIRNPLTGISITLDILREEQGLSAEGQEMITDISREIDRLEALIHGVLDFARPQPVQHRPMRLAKALEWHRTFREQCRKKGLSCHLDLEANPKIQGDPERLKQLFLNLAINALDATDPGGRVTLRTCVDDSPEGRRQVWVEIQDTGRGMDEQTVQQVFDPFFTTKNEGTGLGLSIAHSIAEQHGGTIEVTSAPGAGTTFRVELPAYETEGS